MEGCSASVPQGKVIEKGNRVSFRIGTMKPILGILILNHNGRKWLAPLYDSILTNGYSNKRIYLVDNASEDGSVEETLMQYPEITVIRLPQNLGYCMAYNLAMPQAIADGCEWLIWANNDIRLEPGCLANLVEVSQSDLRIGVLGPAFLAWDGDEPNEYIQGNHPNAIPAIRAKSRQPIDVEWVEGSFLMASRKCLEAVGPLDPYLYFYWEEADFCRRARHRGWRVVLVPGALARHYAGGSSNGDPNNKTTANHLQARNYYIYKLSNPSQSFGWNLLNSFHLFLVNLKYHFPERPSLVKLHTVVFLGVLRDLGTIHHKRIRDRKGKHPPQLLSPFHSISIEVIKGREGY